MRFADVGAILTFEDLLTLHRNGVDGINPYIDPNKNAKDCTAEYLRDIYRAGLYLGGFFVEDSGGAPVPGMVTGDEYFDDARGRGHAAYVNARLRAFAERGLVPPGVRCWYADDTRLREDASFDDYATAIEETAIPELQAPGVYGFESLLRSIQERQPDGRMRYPNVGPRAFLTYGHAQGLVLDGWQNEQVTIEGITVDLSEMFIPGWRPQEEKTPVPPHQHPEYLGESVAVIVTTPNDPDPEKRVARCRAIWRWPDGREHTIEEKYYSDVAKMAPVVIYPPVDPDADPTKDLCAQPGVFIVAATTAAA